MNTISRAYGLTIDSDVALPGPQPAQGPADVIIREGAVPGALESIETETLHWSANASELLLRVPRIGRFHVRDGRQVTYAPSPGAPAEEVAAFLLGSCLGAAMHQRGRTVLHGSVVARDGASFAICGKSGTGKSTTAAWLVEQGARIMSDDLAVFSSVEPPLMAAGFPESRLTRSALETIGRSTADLRVVSDTRDKFALPRTAAFHHEDTPLRAIIVLERIDTDDLSIARASGVQAIGALIKHTYRRHFVVGSIEAGHLDRIGRIVRQVPVWLVMRPRHMDSTDFVVSSIRRIIENGRVEGNDTFDRQRHHPIQG